MTSHLYRYLYKQGQLGGTVIDTLSTAVSGSLCCFIACHGINSKLVMYFTVNTVFIDYLDQFPNLTESLRVPDYKE